MYSKRKSKPKASPKLPASDLAEVMVEIKKQIDMLWQMGAYLGTRIENIEGNRILEQSIFFWRQDDGQQVDD
jgi:hypothetical protein